MRQRTPILLLLIASAILLGLPVAAGEVRPEKTAVEMVTPAAQRAISRGLESLASMQQEDGSYAGGFRATPPSARWPGWPFSPEEARRIADRTAKRWRWRWIICWPMRSRADSSFSRARRATADVRAWIRNHVLAECYGMSQRPDLREKLEKAVAAHHQYTK